MAEILVKTGETIISKTDLQGKILSGNDVFFRISGYSEKELIGRPHNILRHPDMPRTDGIQTAVGQAACEL